MQKPFLSILLVCFLWLSLTTGIARAYEPPCVVSVTHHLYSGMPLDPHWQIENYEAKMALQKILSTLNRIKVELSYLSFGLGSYTIYDPNGCLTHPIASSIAVDDDLIQITRKNGKVHYYADPKLQVLNWIKSHTSETETR